jgi:hypothetical protein
MVPLPQKILKRTDTDWNPDDLIEDLWLGIKECQHFATRPPTEPIPDAAAIRLVLAALEKAGVFSPAIKNGATKLQQLRP